MPKGSITSGIDNRHQGKPETEQNPVGLLDTKAFLCPTFSWLQEIGFIQPPWPSLSSKEQVQTVANQGREGTGRQGRSSQETIVQPWGRVLVPPQGIHITISLTCFADTEIPTRWKKLTVCCPQAHRPQTDWKQKADGADSQLPHHQPIRRVSTSWPRPPSSLDPYYKTPHYPLQVGTHSFWGH